MLGRGGERVVRSYEQRCPVTRALDVVGDRWTLVIVRDLLDGPRRFGRLRSDLAGISPTLLSERLARLVDGGLVVAGDDGYELTERGRALTPVVDELGRWGVELMGREHGSATDAFHEHFRRLGLRFVLRPEALPDRPFSIAFDIDGDAFVMRVAGPHAHDRLSIETGAGSGDVSVAASIASVYSARRGRRSLAELEADGVVVDGPPDLTAAVRAALAPA